MTGFPTQARVVIIGGGVVGTSALYHLARAGWTDALLLERNELTAGSTWHAAGNVPTFSSSWSIMNMQRYSADLYRRLGAEVDYPMNYHVTGSLRLGHSRERMQEFARVVGMGRYQGMELDLLGPSEMKGRYPFLETHDLQGALYDPNDGDIDPAQLTQALAKGARQMGARIERFCPVTAVRREGDEWVIVTPKGEVRCEKVVNAAGYYAREVGAMFGRDVPMMVMSHQYLLFDTIPELADWSTTHGAKLPLLRDVDSSYYLRQEKHGFNLGPYEGNCRAHWITPDDPMPEDFSFQLFPDDLERLEWHIHDYGGRPGGIGATGMANYRPHIGRHSSGGNIVQPNQYRRGRRGSRSHSRGRVSFRYRWACRKWTTHRSCGGRVAHISPNGNSQREAQRVTEESPATDRNLR